MSPLLLAPLGLAALAAWLLPLLIHLVRRVELETTPFAALRWIGARVQPQRRLRFERPWLLLLRLLLLGLLALLLARLALETPPAAPSARVYVVPGADRDAAAAAFDVADAGWHWLAPGFPRLDEPAPTGPVAVASLLREADARLPAGATLRVVVPRRLGGLDGERVGVAHPLEWRVVDGESPAAAASPAEPVRVAVRHAPGDAGGPRYAEALVAAWNAREPGRYTLDVAPAGTPLDAGASWLFWLAPTRSTEVDDWIRRGGSAVLVTAGEDGDPLWRDATGRVAARERRIGAGRAIALPGAFTPEALPQLLDPAFPADLRAALAGPAPAPDRADASAVQPVPRTDAAAALAGIDRPVRTLDAWLALAIAAAALVERLVAVRRREDGA